MFDDLLQEIKPFELLLGLRKQEKRIHLWDPDKRLYCSIQPRKLPQSVLLVLGDRS